MLRFLNFSSQLTGAGLPLPTPGMCNRGNGRRVLMNSDVLTFKVHVFTNDYRFRIRVKGN